MNERIQGKVKLWKIDNGYGFIEVPGQADVFIHFSAVTNFPVGINVLDPGTALEFEVVPGKEGKLQAAQAVIL